MADSRPIEPEYDDNVNWEYEWYSFMERYKLWKRELFDNRLVQEKESWEAVRASMLHSGLTDDRMNERKKLWNKTCWKNLCCAVYKFNKNKERRSWQSGTDGYSYKWLISLHLAANKTMTDAYEAATTFCQVVKWVERADYCIEFHTETSGHPHAHMLIYTNNNRMTCISNVRNSLIKGDKITNPDLRRILIKPSNIDIKAANVNSYNYIKGIKTDNKEDNVNADKHLRIQYGLEDFYTYTK